MLWVTELLLLGPARLSVQASIHNYSALSGDTACAVVVYRQSVQCCKYNYSIMCMTVIFPFLTCEKHWELTHVHRQFLVVYMYMYIQKL